jgi:hypothetical protein
VDTPRGKIPVEQLQAGDMVLSVIIDELSAEDNTPGEFSIGSSLTLSGAKAVETQVTAILETIKTAIVYFNGNDAAKYSAEQPLFVKVGDSYEVRLAGKLAVGDHLIKVDEDGTSSEELITEVTTLDTPTKVYQISCDPYHWFIAGGYLSHNK